MDKWIQNKLNEIEVRAAAAAKLNTTIPMLLEHKKNITNTKEAIKS